MSPAPVVQVESRGLIDTGALILLAQLNPDELPEMPLISAITPAELSVGPFVAADDLERSRRQAHLQQAEADFEPLPFDSSAARAFCSVVASLRACGRKPPARAYDALIAASALASSLPLHTCNPSDFQGIDGPDLRPIPRSDA